ncbi:hypothetical protein CVV26_01375 [Candidatus Kuenenbacteria bacterium HGW-Kuenenbacteria-1]|uniref:PilN domain-containing protein n=1 Tax=Candidatus Kuenenbacteria bacterium HGW-Kuenenbacteria-1 TaxID=2013812 RepID=A0A2N1UNT7_9BACT|nr:MAG: hypothetical protein CVV26_01375 [Candidatus Kuenenbacteria bacterium HGW-Kuenenbacteria-1]
MQDPNLLPDELRKKEEELEKRKVEIEPEKIKLSNPKERLIMNKDKNRFLNKIKSFFYKKSEKFKNEEIQDVVSKLKREEKFREKASFLASAPLQKMPDKKIEQKLTESAEQIKREKEDDQTSKGIEINLIPEEMRSFVKPVKQMKDLGKIFIGSVVVVVIFCVGLFFYKINIDDQLQNIQIQIKKIDKELINYSEFKEKDQLVQMRIKLTQKLIDNHIYWMDVLNFLEENTIKDIVYTNLNCNFDLSQNNDKAGTIAKISIEGVGKDFISIKNQLLIFQKATNFVKKVEISELLSTKERKKKKESKDIEGIGFKIDIELQPGILQHAY